MTFRSAAAAGRVSALLAAATLLAGCGAGDEPQPGPATQGEQRALSDAAEMLDDRPQPTPAATGAARPAEAAEPAQ